MASPELLYASIFIDRQGKPAAPPRPDPQQPGLFRAGEDVAGSLILRYNSHYRLLRPLWSARRRLAGYLAPCLVTRRHHASRDATAARLCHGRPQRRLQVRVERKVWPPGVVWSYFSNQAKEETGEKLLAETGRVTDTEKNRLCPGPGQLCRGGTRPRVSLQDQQGRRWTMRLAGKT